MTRTMLFDSPFLLGFEQTRALIERAAKAAADSYPPYNVEALSDDCVRITLAVAGFSASQLNVTVEGRQLTVQGRRDGETPDPTGRESEKAYLHRGIAARGFVRAFVLADGMEVESASLEHGLLHVIVVRPEPECLVKQIVIKTAG